MLAILLAVSLCVALSSFFVLQADASRGGGHGHGGGHWGGDHHDWGDDEDGEETDVCANIDGAQTVVPEGMEVESVMTDPGSEAVEEVSHVVHHDAVMGWRHWKWVVIREAYDEVVIDVPAQDAVAPTYEDHCVAVEVPADTDDETTGGDTTEGDTTDDTTGGTTEGDTTDETAEEEPAPAPEVIRSSSGGGGKCLNCGDDTKDEDAEEAKDADTDETSASKEDEEDEEEGEVLGASCTPLLKVFLRKGEYNPSGEMTKLQTFLNKELGKSVPVTGVFDDATIELVNEFQLKYADDVLAPWVAYGLPNAQTPTGYVFKTTLHKINMLACPTLELPKPEL